MSRKNKYTRIQFDVSDEFLSILDQLQKDTDSSTRAETIRTAVIQNLEINKYLKKGFRLTNPKTNETILIKIVKTVR